MYKSKRIGLLIPNLLSGGAERVLSLTSILLTQAGYEVYFILFDIDNISYEFSGKLINLKSKAGSTIFHKIFQRLARIIKLSYYKKKYELDTIISFLYAANVVNYYSIGKSKKILSCRGYADYIENGKKYSMMLNKVESVIVQTERMKSDFVNNYSTDPVKINVIHNPFDIKGIANKSMEDIDNDIIEFIENHKTICTMGSFKKDKGYWHLIKAFIHAKKSVNNLGLVIIGERGEMRQEIRKMVENSDYCEDILFMGYQENPFKYISKCTLFVSTSINEGFPNALVEAMACGLPVISTDCMTGPWEILTCMEPYEPVTDIKYAEYGILIQSLEDVIDFDINIISPGEVILSKAIVTLLLDDNLINKYSSLAKERADHFEANNYTNKLIELLSGEFYE